VPGSTATVSSTSSSGRWHKTWSTPTARSIELVEVGTSGWLRADLDAFVVVK
jgi:hypothetical protein